MSFKLQEDCDSIVLAQVDTLAHVYLDQHIRIFTELLLEKLYPKKNPDKLYLWNGWRILLTYKHKIVCNTE